MINDVLLQRYDELHQSIEMMCIITKNVGLLPWVVFVSGISSYFDDGSSTLLRSVSVELYGTCWWNILTLTYEQQKCHSSITSDWWTSYIWNFLLLDEQLHQDIYMVFEVGRYCFNDYWCNIFRHPSIIFLICNLVDEHSSCLHSFRQRLSHQVCS